MADRLLVFSNPEVRKVLREDFIPLAGDDWYQRRRKDAEGEFFQKVAGQGPRSGSGTRQGHYVFTAQGKLLGYNNNRGPERRLKMMRDALEKWKTLSQEDKGGSVEDRGKLDDKYARLLPEDVQVVKVSSRILEERDGKLMAPAEKKIGTLAAVDHLWLKKDEVKKLYELVKNGGGEFPEVLKRRIARYHLNDSTRGEALSWRADEIRTMKLAVNSEGLITGKFSIGSSNEKIGYEGEMRGRLSFTSEEALAVFECLVVGKHWGEGPWTKGARPGKTPYGQVMQLTPAKAGRDRVPPQHMRNAASYWTAN